jgi:hypothetical protein
MPGRSGKQAKTPPKSVAKKGKGSNRYDYTELGKCSLSSAEEQHVYGVIIDSSFPYKTNSSKYVCSLKIVDPTLNTSGSKGGDYASVVMYAKRFEDLPIVLRAGDIIRLHRASLRIYNNRRQFNLSMNWTSSWALFSTDKAPVVGGSAGDFAPVSHSGSSPTMEKQDHTMIGNLRKWAQTHFGSNDVITKDMHVPLAKAKNQSADFDVCAKIVGIHEMDAYTNELKLRDNATGSTWYTMAIKLKFPHLRTGQAVRIRSATCDETSTGKNVLSLSHYSNIMTFINGSKMAAGLSKVTDDWKADSAELNKAVPTVAVTVSEVERKWANLPQTSLEELFTSKNLSGDTFRTTFCVARVEPGDLKEATKSYNKKAKTASSAKGAKGGDLIWNVQLSVKDVATLSNANCYRMLNYSHEGLGANFFGAAKNMHTDGAAHKKLEKQVGTLLKFNAWVDAVVERRNGWYYIKDTKLRC